MNSFMRNLVVWVVLGSLMVYVFNNIDNSSAREKIPREYQVSLTTYF